MRKVFILNILSMLIILHLILLLFSCVNQNSNTVHDLKQEKTKIEENINILNGIWKQYKKIDVITEDTIPDNNCYLKIKDNVIKYELSGKIKYCDTLVHDTLLRYTLKNRHYDILNCYLRKDTIIIISCYELEGNEEFFRKIHNY